MRYGSFVGVCLLIGCGSPAGGNASDGTGTATDTATDTESTASSSDPSSGSTSGVDSTGGDSGGSSTGVSCEPTEPVDAAGFVPAQIAIDAFETNGRPLGDINGDGLGDFVMQDMVVFGRESTDPIVVADIMSGVGGIWFGLGDGRFLANAGRFDLDDTPDLLLGNPNADHAGNNLGRVYLLRGKTDTTPWDAGAIDMGAHGPVIDGNGGSLGASLEGVGDLNGDGLDDVLLAAASLDTAGFQSGRLYCVFGGAGSGVWTEADIGAALPGWQVDATAAETQLGARIAALGDLNGDGTPDYAISYGQVTGILVIFGGPGVPDLAQVAAGVGGYFVDLPTRALAAGDVNGDGLADLIAGNHLGVWVAYGKADSAPITAEDIEAGVGGYHIPGLDEDYNVRVSFLGDYDGDGFGDFIVGDPSHDDLRGRALFVLGGCEPAGVAFSEIAAGVGGFAVEGEPDTGYASSVSGIGDINGDGLADALVSNDTSMVITLGAPL